ncbi:MAG: class I SAM-dependent rRNA methyltransferase [Pseudomonadota bacterium]
MALPPSSLSDRPVIRLKPNADARRLRHGAPWVYGNELVLDRRTKKLPAGSLAVLEDAGRAPIGVVAVNMASKIAGRILTRDVGETVDAAWIDAKIAQALALRERLYVAPFYRLVHAEGDGLPGVVIDRFGDVAVLQANAAWADARKEDFAAALAARGMPTVILNGTGRARSLEGLPELRTVIAGAAPEGPVPVPMSGATYMADLLEGQKTGLFYDQRPNHAFLQGFVSGGTVLDVFCHVGGFGLAALAAGAARVTGVDGSAAALALAEQGARRMEAADRYETRQGDAFEVLTELNEAGAQYDHVVCDPPAFAPAKPALEAGLRAYEKTARLAAPLVAPGGTLVLCSCSHAATLDKFRSASLRGVARAGRAAQVLHTGAAGPDHPQHPALAETSYLKAVFLRLL